MTCDEFLLYTIFIAQLWFINIWEEIFPNIFYYIHKTRSSLQKENIFKFGFRFKDLFKKVTNIVTNIF